ncbi:MAG: hypothetical protein AB7L71_19825 [Vicinamibacterales bacterium]
MIGRLWCSVIITMLASTSGVADEAPYAVVGRVPAHVANGPLNRFHFDPVARRVYAPNGNGVYWVDMQSAEPMLNGPLLFKRPGLIAIAPDVGRMYFASDDGFGFLNLRGAEPPTFLTREGWRGGSLVYERIRHEIYAPTRNLGDRIAVYNADTGAPVTELALPGGGVNLLQAAPGQVFFSLSGAFGLHVIDATTRTVSPWPVDGARVAPRRIEVEPSGRIMIAAYDRHLVAIDIPSARTIAQLPAVGLQSFAFDPARRAVVVAIQDPPDHPRVHLRVYALGTDAFTLMSTLKNPAEDTGWLVSTTDGFLQRTRDSLLVWKARPAESR